MPFQGYLLDDDLLVFQAGEQKPRFEHWNIQAGRFVARVRLSDQIVVVLRADIRGDVLIGTTDDMMGKMGAFDLRRDSKPNPRLLAAAPPDRPHLRPPPANPVDFDGAYEADLPETVGKSAPMVGATLRCKDGTCTFAMGKDSKEVYDKLGSINPSHYSQAKFALAYAKEHKANASEEAPHLSALLDSDSNLYSCVDLGYINPRFPGADMPGLTILCKLDRNPWKKPVVLLMGTILANCGPGFCRYAIVPMFRQ